MPPLSGSFWAAGPVTGRAESLWAFPGCGADFPGYFVAPEDGQAKRKTLILLDSYAWRWGAKRYAGMLDIAKGFTLDPAAITCPLLSIAGEKE